MSPQSTSQDNNVNGSNAPVDDSGASKGDGEDAENPNNSTQDDGTITSNLDYVLDEAGEEITKDMSFK